MYQTVVLQGSKIRASYIAFAQKEKKRLEGEVAASQQEIAAHQKEVDRLQGAFWFSAFVKSINLLILCDTS